MVGRRRYPAGRPQLPAITARGLGRRLRTTDRMLMAIRIHTMEGSRSSSGRATDIITGHASTVAIAPAVDGLRHFFYFDSTAHANPACAVIFWCRVVYWWTFS